MRGWDWDRHEHGAWQQLTVLYLVTPSSTGWRSALANGLGESSSESECEQASAIQHMSDQSMLRKHNTMHHPQHKYSAYRRLINKCSARITVGSYKIWQGFHESGGKLASNWPRFVLLARSCSGKPGIAGSLLRHTMQINVR